MEKRRYYTFYSLLIFAFACNPATDPQNQQSNPMTTGSEGRSNPVELQGETKVDDDAMTFMKKAAHGGTMEVEFGKLAQEKAQNPRVKMFGEMMVRDHTTANQALLDLGTRKAVQINAALSTEHQQKLEDLKKLSGAQFDRQYMDMMVKDHVKDIEQFEQAADNRDPDVNQFATKTLTVLRMHLDSAKAIHASLTKK